MKNLSRILIVPLVFVTLLTISPRAQAASPVITNYNLPCQKDSQVSMTTFHSVNRNGTGKLDSNRRSYDIQCAGNLVFAPAKAKVYSVGNGMLRLDDTANNACLVFVHITDIAVGKGMTVRKGTFLGRGNGAGGHVHVASVNGPCSSWPHDYDYDKKGAQERRIKWVEFNKVLPNDIGAPGVKERSQNPGDVFVNGRSSLTITKRSVNLKVCASNLGGYRTVYVSFWRPAAGSRPAWYKSAKAQARNNCALFYLEEDAGRTLPGVTYYTVASLAPIPAKLASLRRTSCGSATGGAELCDAARR